MPVPTVPEFYRRNVPNPYSKPFIQEFEWTSGTTPDYTVDPQTDEVVIVDEIHITIPRNLDLSSSDLEIQGYPDGKGGTKVALSSLDDMKKMCAGVMVIDTFPEPEELTFTLKPKPGIKLTHTGAETLVFHNSVAVDHTFTGWLKVSIHGWFLSESDY